MLCYDHNLRLMWTRRIKVGARHWAFPLQPGCGKPHLHAYRCMLHRQHRVKMYGLYIWTADVITLWPYLLHVRAVSLAREGRKPPHCHIPVRLIAPSHLPHGHSKPMGDAQEEVPPWAHAGVREVALLVSNHSMRVGDRGVVVVGGSAQTGDLAGHFAAGALLMMDGLFNGQCWSCLPSSFTCSNLE